MLQGIRLQIAQFMKKKTKLNHRDLSSLQELVKNLKVENNE